jgi:hypothetical protein
VKHAARNNVTPFSFDLSSLAPRTVASLYSHLVTRPTGRALRLGIESQIGEMGGCCLSILDFTQVVVLDYSCADEAVAKLLQRYGPDDRPADVYFVARGLGERHREPLEVVLQRQNLVLVAEIETEGFELLGGAGPLERSVWAALENARSAGPALIAAATDATVVDVRNILDGLAHRRVAVRQSAARYWALSALVDLNA